MAGSLQHCQRAVKQKKAPLPRAGAKQTPQKRQRDRRTDQVLANHSTAVCRRATGPEAVLPLRDLPSAGGGSVLVTGNTVLGGSLDEFAEIVARSINRRGQFA